jgi:xylulokinase
MAPPPACFLGIDVGRDGLTLVLLATSGDVLASLDRSYAATPSATTDPQDWWRAARTGIKELLRRCNRPASAIRCIGVTGDSSGFVALDREGKVLCTTTLGPDPRFQEHADLITRSVGGRNLLNLASGPATDAAAATKLLWVRDNEKRVWHDLAHILSPKDFLRFRLTETLVTDASDAAASLLFSPKGRTWSKQLLATLGVNPAWLPTISSGQLIAGRVTADAARESGLQAGTPVVTGAGHVASAAVAVGVLHPGAALVELGGDGAVFIPTADSVRDPSGRLASTCHTLPGTWALTATGLTGGAGLDWLMREVLTAEVAQARRSKREPLELLAELAAEVPPGSDGLLFLPPSHPLPGFAGLSWKHQRGHLVRAVLESGALALRQAMLAAEALKRRPEQIVVTGGGATNTLWCQLLADALAQPVHAIPGTACDAIGAAMLASSAVGIFKNIDEACAKMVGDRTSYQPRRAATEAYDAVLPRLAAIEQAFRPRLAQADAAAT